MNSHRKFIGSALAVTAVAGLLAADGRAARPWQQLQSTTAAEAAAQFASPPPEYGASVTWGWDGPVTEELIARNLDTIKARGLRVATIEAGYGMENAPYLSDGWFKMIRYAAEQAAARDLRLWIIDEGKYPSGFAGGKFSEERPDLRMQALVTERIEAAAGETITRPLDSEVLSLVTLNTETSESYSWGPITNEFRWTAPPQGKWQVLITRHEFRTPDTRAVNDPTRSKTTRNAMGDLLSPTAVGQFIAWTHDSYARHVGDHLGKTILGFRGDEPDFGGTPWTPVILDEFQRRKGYDARPFLPFFVGVPRGGEAPRLTEAQRRAKADYWDVWSDLFSENFFKAQADWCAAHGVEYMVHLNSDHDLFQNVRNSGDFFKDQRYVQVPGIDVIWSQIYPGRGPADFPKFASSVAHVYGHPRALSESFAAFRDPITVDVARWVVNQQFARGINLFEFMFFRASSLQSPSAPPPSGGSNPATGRSNYLADPAFPALAEYTNRVQYLLAQGRPAAQIAVYAPTSSFWLGDQEANASLMKITRQLLEAQRDFDFVDEQALASVMELAGGAFTNLSGQSYRAVVLPAVTVVSRATLERLRRFAQHGGLVVIVGRDPALVADRNFLEAVLAPDLSWAHREPAGEITPAVLTALPAPDVRLDRPCPDLKYTRRRLDDADGYFFFNEGAESISRTVVLAGNGTAQIWDAASGRIAPLAGSVAAGDTVQVAIHLDGHESRLIVVGAALPPSTFPP